MKLYGVFVLFLIHIHLAKCAYNNVCPTYKDYYTIRDNPRCWYDFTADSNATEIILRHGYPLEVHRALTPDGYILTVFRIPNYGHSRPVFLQHGLVSTSANFLGKGKDSLAFVLADAGYDVWLGNFRGTQYSEGHVNLTVNDRRYWDHSMDELGLFDIPVQLELVATKTGQRGNIIYIGHSLGTTVGLIYSSWFPKEAKDTVKMFILLAPAGTLLNMLSPLRYMALMADQLLNFVEANDLIRLVSQAEPLQKQIKPVCLESPILMERCMEAVNMFYGPRTQTGPEMVPIYYNQLPGGTSIKVTRHAADLVFDSFTRYNFGFKNIEKYGSLKPPRYDVSKIQVPVYIMYAINDWTCGKRDSWLLYKRLSSKARAGIYEISEPNFNHIDFLFGRNVKSLVYEQILKVLNKAFQG